VTTTEDIKEFAIALLLAKKAGFPMNVRKLLNGDLIFEITTPDEVITVAVEYQQLPTLSQYLQEAH